MDRLLHRMLYGLIVMQKVVYMDWFLYRMLLHGLVVI